MVGRKSTPGSGKSKKEALSKPKSKVGTKEVKKSAAKPLKPKSEGAKHKVLTKGESIRPFLKLNAAFRRAVTRAIDNVLAFGDTDVLPRSFELAVVAEMREEVEDLVAEIHLDFFDALEKMPVVSDVVLSPVGTTGFRSVSQLDPIWNIYFLSLVIAIGKEIENARIPASKGVVHSFRFDESGLSARVFDSANGWQTFNEAGRDNAKCCTHVLVTDISDFYPRIYHHRLDNALKKVCPGSDLVPRIGRLLMELSGGVSYGLPVGGPASRLLAELLLNATDRKLLANGSKFTRFVDDFRIFSPSREAAYGSLISLAQFIGANEGLSLQKNKTKVLSSEEYLSVISPGGDDMQDEEKGSLREFMQLKIHFDPYSETAEQDYEELKKTVQGFDVVGMLAAEMRKSQIDEGLVKKVVKSVRHLDEKRRDTCISALGENLELLAPVFQVVIQTFIALADDLPPLVRNGFVSAVRALFSRRSHIINIPANQSWAIRAIAKDFDDESERILNEIFQSSVNISVRRDVIVAMANGDSSWFISDVRKRFQSLTSWERRAIICASYILDDEGSHWRKKLSLAGFEKIVLQWAAKKKNRSGSRMRIPL